MEAISKGVDATGLERFVQQKSMNWKIDEKTIEVSYLQWWLTPGGAKWNESTIVKSITDNSQIAVDAHTEKDIHGNSIEIPAQEAKPDTSGYEQYCSQFNAEGISAAINDFLVKM